MRGRWGSEEWLSEGIGGVRKRQKVERGDEVVSGEEHIWEGPEGVVRECDDLG